MNEYRIEWILKDGKIVQGATRFASVEAAEADVQLAFRNRINWSSKYRIVAFDTKGNGKTVFYYTP